MSFQKKCPAGTNKIMTMVESGLGTDEIAVALQEMKELKELESVEGKSGDKMEAFPDEIRLIAQALAYRGVGNDDDIKPLSDVLSSAYSNEISGDESFRKGEAISKQYFTDLYLDKSNKWLIVEAPNGQGVETDGAVLGVCCYTTDGISRRNGEIEGNLGAIRLFGVLKQYQGLCIGHRLLKRVESIMFREGCCRSMICIPSPRSSMLKWIERKGYLKVGSSSYPSVSTGHELTIDDVELHMYLKALETVNGISLSAESKDKKYLSIAKELSDSIKLQDQQAQLESSQEKNSIKDKQNMSLPPHWRQNQPIRREESSDDESIEEKINHTVFQAINKDNVRKLIISDEIIVSLDENNVGLEVD